MYGKYLIKELWARLESPINVDCISFTKYLFVGVCCKYANTTICLLQNHLQLKEMTRQMLFSSILLRNVLELILLVKQEVCYDGSHIKIF